MIKVKKIEYICEYKLKIFFSDGKAKIVDFAAWISEGGIYLKPLKKISFFKQVSLDDCKYSICWPNGADFCPDVLYAVGQEVASSHRCSVKKLVKSRQSKVKKPRAARKCTARR